jgi:hypothetical protein
VTIDYLTFVNSGFRSPDSSRRRSSAMLHAAPDKRLSLDLEEVEARVLAGAGPVKRRTGDSSLDLEEGEARSLAGTGPVKRRTGDSSLDLEEVEARSLAGTGPVKRRTGDSSLVLEERGEEQEWSPATDSNRDENELAQVDDDIYKRRLFTSEIIVFQKPESRPGHPRVEHNPEQREVLRCISWPTGYMLILARFAR